MVWRRYWRNRGTSIEVPMLDRVVAVRTLNGPGESNIKRNLVQVVEAARPTCGADFVVRGVGPELIRKTIQGGGETTAAEASPIAG